jgi:hypothetical protein
MVNKTLKKICNYKNIKNNTKKHRHSIQIKHIRNISKKIINDINYKRISKYSKKNLHILSGGSQRKPKPQHPHEPHKTHIPNKSSTHPIILKNRDPYVVGATFRTTHNKMKRSETELKEKYEAYKALTYTPNKEQQLSTNPNFNNYSKLRGQLITKENFLATYITKAEAFKKMQQLLTEANVMEEHDDQGKNLFITSLQPNRRRLDFRILGYESKARKKRVKEGEALHKNFTEQLNKLKNVEIVEAKKKQISSFNKQTTHVINILQKYNPITRPNDELKAICAKYQSDLVTISTSKYNKKSYSILKTSFNDIADRNVSDIFKTILSKYPKDLDEHRALDTYITTKEYKNSKEYKDLLEISKKHLMFIESLPSMTYEESNVLKTILEKKSTKEYFNALQMVINSKLMNDYNTVIDNNRDIFEDDTDTMFQDHSKNTGNNSRLKLLTQKLINPETEANKLKEELQKYVNDKTLIFKDNNASQLIKDFNSELLKHKETKEAETQAKQEAEEAAKAEEAALTQNTTKSHLIVGNVRSRLEKKKKDLIDALANKRRDFINYINKDNKYDYNLTPDILHYSIDIRRGEDQTLTEEQEKQKKAFMTKYPYAYYTGHLIMTNPNNKDEIMYGHPIGVNFRNSNYDIHQTINYMSKKSVVIKHYDKDFTKTLFYEFLNKNGNTNNTTNNNKIKKLQEISERFTSLISKVVNNNYTDKENILTQEEKNVLDTFIKITEDTSNPGSTSQYEFEEQNTNNNHSNNNKKTFKLIFKNEDDKYPNITNSLIKSFLNINTVVNNDESKSKVKDLIAKMTLLDPKLDEYDGNITKGIDITKHTAHNYNRLPIPENNTSEYAKALKAKGLTTISTTVPSIIRLDTPFMHVYSTRDKNEIKNALTTIPLNNERHPYFFVFNRMINDTNLYKDTALHSTYKHYFLNKTPPNGEALIYIARQHAKMLAIFTSLRDILNDKEKFDAYIKDNMDEHLENLTSKNNNGNNVLIDMFMKTQFVSEPMDLIDYPTTFTSEVGKLREESIFDTDHNVIYFNNNIITKNYAGLFNNNQLPKHKDLQQLSIVLFNIERNKSFNFQTDNPILKQQIEEAAVEVFNTFNTLTAGNITIDADEKEPSMARLLLANKLMFNINDYVKKTNLLDSIRALTNLIKQKPNQPKAETLSFTNKLPPEVVQNPPPVGDQNLPEMSEEVLASFQSFVEPKVFNNFVDQVRKPGIKWVKAQTVAEEEEKEEEKEKKYKKSSNRGPSNLHQVYDLGSAPEELNGTKYIPTPSVVYDLGVEANLDVVTDEKPEPVVNQNSLAYVDPDYIKVTHNAEELPNRVRPNAFYISSPSTSTSVYNTPGDVTVTDANENYTDITEMADFHPTLLPKDNKQTTNKSLFRRVGTKVAKGLQTIGAFLTRKQKGPPIPLPTKAGLPTNTDYASLYALPSNESKKNLLQALQLAKNREYLILSNNENGNNNENENENDAVL